jgi:hypothetical protein
LAFQQGAEQVARLARTIDNEHARGGGQRRVSVARYFGERFQAGQNGGGEKNRRPAAIASRPIFVSRDAVAERGRKIDPSAPLSRRG